MKKNKLNGATLTKTPFGWRLTLYTHLSAAPTTYNLDEINAILLAELLNAQILYPLPPRPKHKKCTNVPDASSPP